MEICGRSCSGKSAMIDSLAVKTVKSHMPPGRTIYVFKDLKRAMPVSIYQHNLQSKTKGT